MSIAFNCFNGPKLCHKNINVTHISPKSSKSEETSNPKSYSYKNKFKSSKKFRIKTFNEFQYYLKIFAVITW